MAVVDLTRLANTLGIDTSNDTLILAEQHRIRNYIRTILVLTPVIKIVRNTRIYPNNNEETSAADIDINKMIS
jgi:hypothetical protein